MRVGTLLPLLALLLLASCAAPPEAGIPLPAEGNAPFTLEKGTEKGLLLIHGLSATPWEVRPLAEYIAAHNVTVTAPLLAGHGTTAADLKETRWEDWYRSANQSLALLKSRTRKVYVGGISTGADLAILLAREHEVDGLILIAPPIEFQDWRTPFARYAQWVLPYSAASVVGPETGHYYTHKPTRSVAELNDLIGKVKTALPKVTAKTLILQSIDDETVKPLSAEYVYEHIGSPMKELRLYGNATHVLVQEQDAPDVVFYSVDEFIRMD